MKARHDGGPAFPQNDATVNRINNLDGMSLRDYFAGQALVGLSGQVLRYLADEKGSGLTERGTFTAHDLAATCYQVADAMLKARDADHD